MLIDCDTCTVRGKGCADCVVAALYGPPVDTLDLDPVEQRAVQILLAAGFELSGVPADPAPPARVQPARRNQRPAAPATRRRRGHAA